MPPEARTIVGIRPRTETGDKKVKLQAASGEGNQAWSLDPPSNTCHAVIMGKCGKRLDILEMGYVAARDDISAQGRSRTWHICAELPVT